MGPIPPEMSLEEYDRRAAAEIRADRAAGGDAVEYPAEAARSMLVELERQLRAGVPVGPATVAELLDRLPSGAPS